MCQRALVVDMTDVIEIGCLHGLDCEVDVMVLWD
jgi:hypothetical protein